MSKSASTDGEEIDPGSSLSSFETRETDTKKLYKEKSYFGFKFEVETLEQDKEESKPVKTFEPYAKPQFVKTEKICEKISLKKSDYVSYQKELLSDYIEKFASMNWMDIYCDVEGYAMLKKLRGHGLLEKAKTANRAMKFGSKAAVLC